MRRTASAAGTKSPEDLAVDASPTDTAALLSLAGVAVVAVNQWGSSFAAHDTLLRGVNGCADVVCCVVVVLLLVIFTLGGLLVLYEDGGKKD